MSNARERRRWALELSAVLLRSDMDCFDPDEFEGEDEKEKRRAAVLQVADELEGKMLKIKVQTK